VEREASYSEQRSFCLKFLIDKREKKPYRFEFKTPCNLRRTFFLKGKFQRENLDDN